MIAPADPSHTLGSTQLHLLIHTDNLSCSNSLSSSTSPLHLTSIPTQVNTFDYSFYNTFSPYVQTVSLLHFNSVYYSLIIPWLILKSIFSYSKYYWIFSKVFRKPIQQHACYLYLIKLKPFQQFTHCIYPSLLLDYKQSSICYKTLSHIWELWNISPEWMPFVTY